jgi:hypothetical protein
VTSALAVLASGLFPAFAWAADPPPRDAWPAPLPAVFVAPKLRVAALGVGPGPALAPYVVPASFVPELGRAEPPRLTETPRPAPPPLSPARAAGLEWMFSAEAPAPPPVASGFDAAAFSGWPAPAALSRQDLRAGRLVATALYRQLGTLPGDADRPAGVGAGGGFSGRLTGFAGADELSWSAVGGRGAATHFAGPAGLDVDPALGPDALFAAPSLVSVSAAYRHALPGERLALTARGSLLHVYDLDATATALLQDAQYLGGALEYAPRARLVAGLDYLYGQRESAAGASAVDQRVQLSASVAF